MTLPGSLGVQQQLLEEEQQQHHYHHARTKKKRFFKGACDEAAASPLLAGRGGVHMLMPLLPHPLPLFTQGKATMMIDGKSFRDIDCNCWSPDQRIRECNETGVDPEHTLDLARYLNDHIAQTVAENPKRFIGTCSETGSSREAGLAYSLERKRDQAPELAVQELRRCVGLGLQGVQIGSHVNDWNLDAPELEPVFARIRSIIGDVAVRPDGAVCACRLPRVQAAEELNTAIFVHPWDMETKGRMKDYWFPWLIGMPCETTQAICSLIFGGVLERHPHLK
ncbi:MAG: hypothetical protein BJ554DRAFT_1102, partial [Olpidium bornovanus]